MLDGFQGELVVDGYSAYGAAARARGGCFRVATCWSHARRTVLEAEESYPEAAEALDLIGEMFLIERDLPDWRCITDQQLRAKALAQIRETRQARTRPLVEALAACSDDTKGAGGREQLTAPTPRWHGPRVNEQSFPVTILVKRPDGSSEQVRVGTAVRTGEGFRLSLGELSIGAVADSAVAPARRAAPSSSSGAGLVFPPYGNSKGAPIVGATLKDLEFYRNGCMRTLADQGKARWHDKERALLAAIEAEIARQQNGGQESGFDGGRASGFGLADGFDDSPAHSDDDIPF